MSGGQIFILLQRPDTDFLNKILPRIRLIYLENLVQRGRVLDQGALYLSCHDVF